MEIRNFNREIVFQTDKENIKDTVEDAVKRGADLRGADLRGANLRGANLGGANLGGANLRGANLRAANLSYADLRGAKLIYSDLSYADFRSADLRAANLGYADFRAADLRGANLGGADLSYADFRAANLRAANLSYADLGVANLSYADLRGANFRGAENIPFVPIACPSDGEFAGWKKVHDKLIELRIPADAKKSSATNDRCRCDKALVVSITDIKTGDKITEIVNYKYKKTAYCVGKMVFSDSFDDNQWVECSHGIHFFINKESAINY